MLKNLPSKPKRMTRSNYRWPASGRRIGQVQLGRDVLEDDLDVEVADEVPHGSDDGLDVSGCRSALGGHCEGRLVVDEGQDMLAAEDG